MSETPPSLRAVDTSTASLLLMIGRLQGHMAAMRHALHHRIDRFREGLNDQGGKIEELQLDVKELQAKLEDYNEALVQLEKAEVQQRRTNIDHSDQLRELRMEVEQHRLIMKLSRDQRAIIAKATQLQPKRKVTAKPKR